MTFTNLISRIRHRLAYRNNATFVKYLRSKGMKIGDGTIFADLNTIDIDFARPTLIEIGNNVRINAHMTIMCHDAAAKVFRAPYGEFLPSSGKIKIGNNVYFGRYCSVLKGVTIGDNCVIGFGSTVTKDIPANSVAVGTPAKVICSLDDYFERRKAKAMEEAFEHMRSIKERLHRMPRIEDCNEAFVYFVSGDEVDKYPMLPIKYQLGPGFESYCKSHKAPFGSFEEFIDAAGL